MLVAHNFCFCHRVEVYRPVNSVNRNMFSESLEENFFECLNDVITLFFRAGSDVDVILSFDVDDDLSVDWSSERVTPKILSSLILRSKSLTAYM